MRIGHVAICTENIEVLKDYYIKYFDGTSNKKYHNPSKNFESYFISFESGTQLELMSMPDTIKNPNGNLDVRHLGLTHLAFEVENKEHVDEKCDQIRNARYSILDGPRITGDGYYEFTTLDPDGNRIEVTCKV